MKMKVTSTKSARTNGISVSFPASAREGDVQTRPARRK